MNITAPPAAVLYTKLVPNRAPYLEVTFARGTSDQLAMAFLAAVEAELWEQSETEGWTVLRVPGIVTGPDHRGGFVRIDLATARPAEHARAKGLLTAVRSKIGR